MHEAMKIAMLAPPWIPVPPPGYGGIEQVIDLLAAELTERPAREAADAALRRGLLVNPVTPSALRFAPSLLVTDDEIDEALAVLRTVLATVAADAAG